MTSETPLPPTTPHRASWYQRFFARAMAGQQRVPELEERKRTLLYDVSGNVLEIGPGPGPNLKYYGAGVRWSGLEPNPAMWPYLEEEAKRLGMSIDLQAGEAEQITAADNHFDAVVSTHVLCTVSDPQQTLREILRVLAPGGRFVFVEHVAAPRGSGTRRLQQVLKPLWKPLVAGCHPDRDTGLLLEAAGFRDVHLSHFHLNIPVVGPHIAGYAVK